MGDRLQDCYAKAKAENRAALNMFLTAGFPDYEISLALLKAMPEAGVDVLEVGMPFSDPMADGPTIQASSLAALEKGQTLALTLQMIGEFRKTNQHTPVILMGYYNPIYQMGVDEFLKACQKAGVDGLIVVDLPPEEDDELCLPAKKAGIHFIRLVAPTTDEQRMPVLFEHASGFVYYISVLGVTGGKTAIGTKVSAALSKIRKHTDLPVAIGFGIKTGADIANFAPHGDGVVVGSALVEVISQASAGPEQSKKARVLEAVTAKLREFTTHLAKS